MPNFNFHFSDHHCSTWSSFSSFVLDACLHFVSNPKYQNRAWYSYSSNVRLLLLSPSRYARCFSFPFAFQVGSGLKEKKDYRHVRTHTHTHAYTLKKNLFRWFIQNLFNFKTRLPWKRRICFYPLFILFLFLTIFFCFFFCFATGSLKHISSWCTMGLVMQCVRSCSSCKSNGLDDVKWNWNTWPASRFAFCFFKKKGLEL